MKLLARGLLVYAEGRPDIVAHVHPSGGFSLAQARELTLKMAASPALYEALCRCLLLLESMPIPEDQPDRFLRVLEQANNALDMTEEPLRQALRPEARVDARAKTDEVPVVAPEEGEQR